MSSQSTPYVDRLKSLFQGGEPSFKEVTGIVRDAIPNPSVVESKLPPLPFSATVLPPIALEHDHDVVELLEVHLANASYLDPAAVVDFAVRLTERIRDASPDLRFMLLKFLSRIEEQCVPAEAFPRNVLNLCRAQLL